MTQSNTARAVSLSLALLVNVVLLSVVNNLADTAPFSQAAQSAQHAAPAAATVAASTRAAHRG